MPDTEGPEKRNPGNREFMREKIVKQPLSKRQIAKRVLILMCLAVLFGVISAVSFVLAKPLADRYLGREETEESTSIVFAKDDPETAAVGPRRRFRYMLRKRNFRRRLKMRLRATALHRIT